MKAIRVHAFGGPTAMAVEDIPDPSPGPGQVVVRIEAAGVNPVDTYIRSGVYALKPPLPYTPGSDGAGIVVASSPETGISPGDRVYLSGSISGTYAELALCEASQVHPLPQSVSSTEGAAVGIPYATAYRALFQKAHARATETVLVHGASGGVGIAAVQLARAAGMTVVGTGGSEEGRQLVSRAGAHHVLDHNDPQHLERLLAVTEGRGADVIIEMLANVNLGRDLQAVASGGRVVIVGSRGTVEVNPRDAMSRDAAVIGMLLFNATKPELAAIHAALWAGLERGSLRPVVGTTLPLADAPRAHELVLESGARGKIVLVP